MDDTERNGGALTLDAGSLFEHRSSSIDDRLPFDHQEAMTSMSSNDEVTSTPSVDGDGEQHVSDGAPKVHIGGAEHSDNDHEARENQLEDEDKDDGMAFAAHVAAQAISESDAAAERAAAAAAVQQQPHAQITAAATKHPGKAMEKSTPTRTKGSKAPISTTEDTVSSATVPASSDSRNAVIVSQLPSPHLQRAPHQYQSAATPTPSTPIPMPVTTSAPVVCRICQRGDEDGRPLLRFLPVEHDMAAAAASPSVITFTQDICLHIFCGKTASILPGVMKPELEILTKAGLKRKHGIGLEVNGALARSRCAILGQEGSKEKHYYLVREFEAHLAAIRRTPIYYTANGCCFARSP